jgi:pyruvate dehydrogenase E1 component beta subunit
MKYKDAIRQSMKMLAENPRRRFLGYNVLYGSKGYGTLVDVPKEQCIETPLAENLMMGLAMGMSLEGYLPVVFFERHDFILNALDGIVNHLGKIEKMSQGQFKLPVIMRATVGGTKPFYPGAQHVQDFTKVLRELCSFPVIDFADSRTIVESYEKAKNLNGPIMFVERRDLYDSE